MKLLNIEYETSGCFLKLGSMCSMITGSYSESLTQLLMIIMRVNIMFY